MKVPDIFTPEKNLEEKTERLLKEEVMPKKYEPKIEKQELEETLNSFESADVHKKIEDLITKSGYTPVKAKKLCWNYWTKPTDFGEDYVFTRWCDSRDIRYAFAIVNEGKLEEFCTRFEKVQARASLPDYDLVKHISIGVMTGGLAGLAFQYAFTPLKLVQYITIFMFGLGAILGSMEGMISYMYTNSRNKKKLKTCYTQLITSNKEAVKAAFS